MFTRVKGFRGKIVFDKSDHNQPFFLFIYNTYWSIFEAHSINGVDPFVVANNGYVEQNM